MTRQEYIEGQVKIKDLNQFDQAIESVFQTLIQEGFELDTIQEFLFNRITSHLLYAKQQHPWNNTRK